MQLNVMNIYLTMKYKPERWCEQPENSSGYPAWTSPADTPEPAPERQMQVNNTFLCVYVHMLCVSYQHKVDVEVKNLVAHIHTEVVAEMVSQVGESTSWALEVSARHLHPLKTEQIGSNCVCKWEHNYCVCVAVPPQILCYPWLPTWSAAPLQSSQTGWRNVKLQLCALGKHLLGIQMSLYITAVIASRSMCPVSFLSQQAAFLF